MASRIAVYACHSNSPIMTIFANHGNVIIKVTTVAPLYNPIHSNANRGEGRRVSFKGACKLGAASSEAAGVTTAGLLLT